MKQTIKFLLAALAAMFVGVSAFAQMTTSSMSGKVVDAAGDPVVGATVVAVHAESGTQYYAVANAEGRYNINGMRAGGPYTVEVACLGYQTVQYTDVTLALAEVFNLNATLQEDSEMLSEAIVISQAASKLPVEQTGAATNISAVQINALPTVSRSITDVTRLSPYGGNGMSFAGADGRTANFTVDGANFNNNFGLSSNLPGGGSPISIEAIEELQVVISPYDVRQTGFIGGGVNAITKSGTNTFKGSAYLYHKNDNLRGDAIAREQIPSAREKDRRTTYGFTFGGPIIKNKLFFFLNAEFAKTPTVANRWRGSVDGVANSNAYVSRTTLADLETVSNHVKDKYGYDTGSWTAFPADENNMKIIARLDWNITDAHRLALRYNYTLNNVWNSPNASSMDGGTRTSGGRTSQYAMSFANAMYSMQNLVHSVSLDLNSRLSNTLNNQLLATFTKSDDIRGTNSAEFPFIDILDGDGQMYMALGYELFTWNNAVHNTHFNLKDDLTWYAGNHKVTGGVGYEYQMADNAYMRNGTGYYRYNTMDDFINGAAPEVVCLTYGYDGEKNPAARVQFHQLHLYAQDEWQATDRFKLTYGLRIDGLFFDNSDLMTNKAIYDIEYPGGRHIDTGKWPSAQVGFSPRVGFNWDVLGDKSLKLRGGSGLFQGRLPLVFFTNMPTNSGMVQYQAQINGNTVVVDKDGKTKLPWYTGATVTREDGSKVIDMSQFAGGLVTNGSGKATTQALLDKLHGLGYPSTIKPEDGTVPSSISAVDPKFKMPQVWKTSLALDYSFPTSFPFSASVEGIFNKTVNAASISDWSIPSVGGFARFNGVDNRPIYPTGFRSQTKAFVLENTHKGYGWSAVVSAKMRPIDGLMLTASYTHTVSKEVTGMPGSAAESAFTYVPTVQGPNNIALHNSQYVTPDRIIASATLSNKCGDMFTIFYETWRGGYNYSAMLTNDMNGDGYNYDALYIPTDAQVANKEFRFVSDNDRDRFMSYVHATPYLRNHQGEYAEGYSFYSPWVHRVDMSYKHDFKVRIGKSVNTLQLSVDLKNALNMLHSSWGVSKIINTSDIGDDFRILKYEGVDADGYATFSTPKGISGSTQTFVLNHAIGQCWYASVGIKYMFN
ncbi:MAG: TonB-dependent receptor [Bacteroidales bacterium]|nr:TonB-dependent receptor [Bacteroidales bacterium]